MVLYIRSKYIQHSNAQTLYNPSHLYSKPGYHSDVLSQDLKYYHAHELRNVRVVASDNIIIQHVA